MFLGGSNDVDRTDLSLDPPFCSLFPGSCTDTGLSLAATDDIDVTAEIPVIPDNTLLTNVPIRSDSGEVLSTLMDGIAPTDFQLEEFVVNREPLPCTFASKVKNSILVLLPGSLGVQAQQCTGCYMAPMRRDCPYGCPGIYYTAYNTGNCFYCGVGYIPGEREVCTIVGVCTIFSDAGCNTSQYCNCQYCN